MSPLSVILKPFLELVLLTHKGLLTTCGQAGSMRWLSSQPCWHEEGQPWSHHRIGWALPKCWVEGCRKVPRASETTTYWYHAAAMIQDGRLVSLFLPFFNWFLKETDLRKDFIFSDTDVPELTCSPATRGRSKLEVVAASMSNWGQLRDQVS